MCVAFHFNDMIILKIVNQAEAGQPTDKTDIEFFKVNIQQSIGNLLNKWSLESVLRKTIESVLLTFF